jgi:hypothetical protein
MPNVGSWNGKWTAEHKLHVVVRNIPKSKIVEPGSHRYDFGDGWCAMVTVSHVDSKEARVLRRKSAGFCGYDWMIDEICAYGRIRSEEERRSAERKVIKQPKPEDLRLSGKKLRKLEAVERSLKERPRSEVRFGPTKSSDDWELPTFDLILLNTPLSKALVAGEEPQAIWGLVSKEQEHKLRKAIELLRSFERACEEANVIEYY